MERRELAMRSALAEASEGGGKIRRAFGPEIKIRGTEGISARTLVGHAAVFNQLSEVIGRWSPFREKIQPGAFAKSMKTRDVVALYQHLSWAPIARTSNGRLLLREDAIGLYNEIVPNETMWGKSTLEAVVSRDVTSMSFGFNVVTDFWQTVDGEEIRTIVEADLIEVSPVTWPAYTQTDISAREARMIAGVEAWELAEAFENCRAGKATKAQLDLVRSVTRDLAAAAGPTPDEIETTRKLKLKFEFERGQLDLLEAA